MPKKSKLKHFAYIVGILVRNKSFAGCVLIITIRRSARSAVTSRSLIVQNSLYLNACILRIKFINDIFERRKIVISEVAVHAVIDSDKVYISLWKKDFCIIAGLQIFTSETRQILDYNSSDLFVLNVSEHFLKSGTIEVSACISVICEYLYVCVTVFISVSCKKITLVLNTHAVSAKFVLMAEPAIKGCYLVYLLFHIINLPFS